MEEFGLYKHKVEQAPDFGLDIDLAEATLALSGHPVRKLIDASYEETTPELTRITGTDAESGETVVFEVLEQNDELHVIKVIVDDQIIYTPTLH